jgi:hypothetical protein
MARENITCQVVDGAETALFNPKTRVLIVPNWSGLTTEQCDLLMSHEIGHALFTDRNVELRKISRGLFTYLNIIEDARIERRMKGAFPGLAPTFYKGYREFHANGPILKGTKDALFHPKTGASIPVATMKLIDRINLHYKIGAFVSVPFSETERVWLSRIDKASSTEECLQIARDLHTQQKEDDRQDQQEQQNPFRDTQKKSPKQEETEESDSQDSHDQESTDGESQDGEHESDASDSDNGNESEDESDEDGQSGSKTDGTDDEEDEASNASSVESENQDSDSLESDTETEGCESEDDEHDQDATESGSESNDDPSAVTDTADQLKDLAKKHAPNSGNTIVNVIYPVLTDDDLKGRTISAAEFTKGAYDALAKANAPASDVDSLENAWNAQFLATAKHMALEFERRKQARQLQAATTGKSGKLDLTKLAQYRFTEDLFKRTMIVPNGKSHGIVMLIDGSGSMSSQFKDVIDQTLLFAQFAFIVNIPFEAYMFSDAYEYNAGRPGDGYFTQKSTGLNSLTLNETGRLIGLVNTTTDRAMFKKNVRALLAVRAAYDRYSTKLTNETWAGIGNIPHSHLSGTPLFMGIMIAERHIARMKQTQKLDKTTFVVITDGEDTNGLHYEATPSATSWRRNANFAQLDGPFVVRDAVTKKNLPYVETIHYAGRMTTLGQHNSQLTMLLDVMKLRHDTRTVYIYLQERGSYRSVYRRRYRRYAQPSYDVQGFDYLVRAGKSEEANKINRATVTATMKEDGQYVLPASMSVADLSIILPVNSVRLTENEFSNLDTEDMTQRKIAAEFTKSMVKAVANRKFVNSVIPHLI